VATLNLARLSRQSEGAERLLAAAAAVACATMLPRILLVVGVLNLPLLLLLIAPLGGAAVVTYLGAGLLWHRSTGDKSSVSVRIDNPFEFWLAVRFGLLLTAIMLLARLVPSWLGEHGVFLLAGIAGLGDVDAISLSMARYGGVSVSLQGAAVAIAIAAFANTVVKAGLAFGVGRSGMAWRLGAVLAASAIVSAAIFLWQGTSAATP
jgi:uncharacterized membrane protein (DUF4010 family)